MFATSTTANCRVVARSSLAIVEPHTDVIQPSHQAATNPYCEHCGLPVPKGLIRADKSYQFCCTGCEVAYELIRSNGLESFYAMTDSFGERRPLDDRDKKSVTQFSEFDLPSFLDKFGRSEGNIHRISLLLDGIHCAACVWLIEKLPQILPGVLDVKLNWARRTALIRWQPDQVQLSRIAYTLDRLGYTPHPVRDSESTQQRRNENRRHFLRIGIAAACAGNNMLIAAALYLGMFSYMSLGIEQLLRVASCVVGLAALFWPGRVFLQGALNALRTRTPHMDLPIALGSLAGSVAGVINTVRGSGEIWFDSLSVLIFLLLVGRWIQFRQQNQAADSVEMLYRLTPKTTRKLVGGKPVETFVDLVQENDVLEIRPGDLFPVDGVIVEGMTEVDEAILSGESCPRKKGVDETVLAGTQNLNSTVNIKTTATGRDTRLSKIVELVEQASLEKPQIVQWANQIGGYFVITVILLAIVNLAWWLFNDASAAFDRTVALLIVACPCALALATPLAVSVAIGRAAGIRIMVKSGDVLQLLARPGILWLDKTGTLTEGNIQVVQWHGDSKWQPIAAALESKSAHPVSASIVDFAKNASDEYTVDDVHEFPGLGIRGQVDGQRVLLGNRRLLVDHKIEVNKDWIQISVDVLKNNLSPCWMAVDNEVVAVIALGDHIRLGTQTAIDQLKKAGWKIGILSGDHQEIVSQVASRLQIDENLAFGGLSPEEKVCRIQLSLDEQSPVVMVGDGVNDSAALAAASVGIAVHNGAEASLAAAPVYLANEGLSPILQLIRLSKSAGRTIRQNLSISIAYNLLGVGLAMGGIINPLIAAVIMPISSLTVVAISLTAGQTTVSQPLEVTE